MRLRPATPDDVDALAGLEADVFAAGEAWSRQSISDEFAAPGRLLLLATEGGGAGGEGAGGEGEPAALVGYVGIVVTTDAADLLRLAVARAARRRGLGRRLVRAAEEAARHAGARRMLLEVADDNAAAVALYRGCGYRELGRRGDYYGPGRDALVLGSSW